MKKSMICIAIMAAGLFVASCGAKNANSAESADSTAVGDSSGGKSVNVAPLTVSGR